MGGLLCAYVQLYYVHAFLDDLANSMLKSWNGYRGIYNIVLLDGVGILTSFFVESARRSSHLTPHLNDLLYSSSMWSVPKESGVKVITSQGRVMFLQTLAM
ncbi:PREDICTED: uncharacterized protein LOC107333330 [Acropora digitifera]|uniref:uncharacterized protein LOC107333330 n=1 Tax=Acropora digitifera TaxID=70779 RepID=UPI00077A1A2F|nr:PREDICTED: uncharacterized protein LOC107333330 [Acropora digitifera]